MLRFKQFLLIEDATISGRQHLQGVYGNANLDIMLAKIKEREEKMGSAEGFAAATDAYQSKTTYNPFVDKEKIATDLKSKFNLNPDTVRTGNRFAIPIYSDKNLDKPITVKSVDPSTMGTVHANTHPVGHEGASDAVIKVRKDDTDNKDKTKQLNNWINDPQAKNDNWYSRAYAGTNGSDLLGHEITHTLQPDFPDYQKRKPSFTQVVNGSNEPETPETAKRRSYTQDGFEPAARMSELKHGYFKQTGKLLPADMTPEDKESFKVWQKDNINGFKTNQFDDTMQLLDTPEGDELFRRTAKVTKPDTSGTRMT